MAATGAHALLGNKLYGLLLDYCLLYPGENRSRFCQRQPERLGVVGRRDPDAPLPGPPLVDPHLTQP